MAGSRRLKVDIGQQDHLGGDVQQPLKAWNLGIVRLFHKTDHSEVWGPGSRSLPWEPWWAQGGLQIDYYSRLRARGPLCKCRLRFLKQQEWEARGPAAPTLPRGAHSTERNSSHSLDQIQGAPEILPRHKDLSHDLSIPLVRPSPLAQFRLHAGPPSFSQPRGGTEKAPEGESRKSCCVGQSIADSYSQPLGSSWSSLNMGSLEREARGTRPRTGREMAGSWSLRVGVDGVYP